MLLYRIARAKFAGDLSGEGAAMYGGRWNPPGTPVVYTSESAALAVLELLANVPHQLIRPDSFRKVVIEVPDSAEISTVAVSDLPADWNRFPHPARLAAIGGEWVEKGETLLLKVPSALVGGDGHNYLINTSHPQASHVRVVSIDPFYFDPRILG